MRSNAVVLSNRIVGGSSLGTFKIPGLAIARVQPLLRSTRRQGRPIFPHQLLHTTSIARRSVQKPSEESAEGSNNDVLASYSAPLAKTFYRLKLFSLSSLGAAVCLTPALLFAPAAEVGIGGRIGVCATALSTSVASTAIFAWMGKPYVGAMRLLAPSASSAALERDLTDDTLTAVSSTPKEGVQKEARPALQALTTDWRLRTLRTTIYEPSLIRPTGRPLATWEMTNAPPPLVDATENEQRLTFPVTKLAASTRMEKGDTLIGRLWVTWPQRGAPGRCFEEGSIIRHYTVHEDQLNDDWRVL